MKHLRPPILGLLLALPAVTALAQGTVTLPPSGNNQRASVTQHVGLVSVTIDYSSPDVHGPNGGDRRGKIWGGLVPYGLTNLGFGNGNPGPWRAGANENTVLTVSHDVLVQGEPLPAGSYGLHMIVGEGEWTLILSNNHTSWGSFFYDEAEDALRVTVKPEKAEYREWLTYDFFDRQQDRTSVALWWEELRVPFTISVPNLTELYLANMRNELRSTTGFTWQGYQSAAQYCLQQGVNLEEALTWAENAIDMPFVGQENFNTLQTKALILERLERKAEAAATMSKALEHPTAAPAQIHGYGRRLLAQGQKEEALEVFELNHKRFGDTWPVHVGLARGYSALGNYAKALEHAKIALEQAPDDSNRNNLENAVSLLTEGKDIN